MILFITYPAGFTAVWEGAEPYVPGQRDVDAKRDYYDDPDAPVANSIVPAVTVIARNDAKPHLG